MNDDHSSEILQVVKSIEGRIAILEDEVKAIAQQRGVSTPVVPQAPLDAKVPSISSYAPQPVTRGVSHSDHAPKPFKLEQPAVAPIPSKSKSSNEIEFGQKWLTIVGVVLIFLATLFFVQLVFSYVGTFGKVVVSYAGAVLLFAVSILTKKKYSLFSGVVGAGAWGITYLVTYAMHFFTATRVITSTPLAMGLLTMVVGALIVFAVHQRSKALVSMGLFLGVLTVVLSPLSLFSIVGTVLLLAAFAIIAVMMPWGDIMLPATVAAYFCYVIWVSTVVGRLPGQGGGLLEKYMIGLIALIAMWLITATAVLLRKDEEKLLEGKIDGVTLLIATVATTFLALPFIQGLVVPGSLRVARGVWFTLLALLMGGWALIAHDMKKKNEIVGASGIAALVLCMTGISYFFPEQHIAVTLAWAVLGFAVIVSGMLMRSTNLAVISMLPFIASAFRYLITDLPKSDFILNVFTGIFVGIVVVIGSGLLRTLDKETSEGKSARQIPSILLVFGIWVLYVMSSREFSGAVPSVLWGVIGLAAVLGGFLANWKAARIVGLVGLAITIVRVFSHDLSTLAPSAKVISFAVLGALLLMVSYGYNHNKEKLQKLMEDSK